MIITKALKDATISTFADQWKEIITAGYFDEHTVVVPGILKTKNMGRGVNDPGSEGIISNGSKIYVPENTAAFIFDQSAIENIILLPGGYEYQEGDKSVFNGDGLIHSVAGQIIKRIGFGGITPNNKEIAFVNLREIRGIKFGTRSPQIFHDPAYGVDLEICAYGSFSVRVADPELFIRNYVPAKRTRYSFDEPQAQEQIVSEFLQSFSVALTSMSGKCRVSQLISMENEFTSSMEKDTDNVGTWRKRFGFELVKASIENIELSDESKALIQMYASKKMEMGAFNDISQKASDIYAQQKIAQGIQDKGLGDMGGMIFGIDFMRNLTSTAGVKERTVEQQIDIVKKLKEAFDAGILTKDEFEAKKKEVLNL